MPGRRTAFANTLVALLLVLAGGSAVAAEADRSPAQAGQVYGTFGSYLFGRDDDADLDAHLGSGFGIGGRITDAWAVELQYSRGISETNVAGRNVDAEIDGYRLDALYDLGYQGAFRPYVVGGVGYFDYDVLSNVANDETSEFINLGGGVNMPVTSRLSSRADARLFYVQESEEILPALTLSLAYVFAGPTTPWPPRDSDGDGVLDRDDQCAGTAPGIDVDSVGCPLDTDRDGVPDASDACPRTPAGVSVDGRGCALDSDDDGVADHLDACPNTPRRTAVDARGCPEVAEQEEVSARIELKLEFDFDSDQLRPGHYAEIERVAEFMRENEGTAAQLEGHTDSRGGEAYNQALSERRAYAVRDYLIDEADIDPRRITAVGYGESQPIASNDTEAGRQRNRRVSAVIETRDMSVRQRRQN